MSETVRSGAAACVQCKVGEVTYSLHLSSGVISLCEACAVTIDEREGHLLPAGCMRRVSGSASGKGK